MSPALLRWGLGVALAAAGAGTLLRVAGWFRVWVGAAADRPALLDRLLAAPREIGRALASRRSLGLVRALGLDILLQHRLARRDPVRWAAHFAVFSGSLGLLLLHALNGVVFRYRLPNVSPWYGLRDVAGLMVVVGLAVGALRRRSERGRLPKPQRRDPLFVGLVAAIMATGFLLTAAKIISAPAFYRMVGTYGDVSGPELDALRVWWAAELGVVFTDRPADPQPSLLATGREQHVDACASCHVAPRAAVVSWPLSRALRPAAGLLAGSHAETGLHYLHALLCLFLLAWLPWSRLFHVVADPLSLLADAGSTAEADLPARANRRALALDACVRCGLCDERCSVRALEALFDNDVVLPAAKLLATRAVAAGRLASGDGLRRVAEGALTCTDCGRCTAGCPAGLDLADLWAAGRADLASRGFSATAVWVKSVPAGEWAERLEAAPQAAAARRGLPLFTDLAHDRHTFSACVQCQTCTNVCPVVEHSSGDGGVDATPQKIMNLLRLGLAELALGSRMVWDCTTCYQCQEHCPAGIRVTEVLYELRNRGNAELGAVVRPGAGAPSAGGAS